MTVGEEDSGVAVGFLVSRSEKHKRRSSSAKTEELLILVGNDNARNAVGTFVGELDGFVDG